MDEEKNINNQSEESPPEGNETPEQSNVDVAEAADNAPGPENDQMAENAESDSSGDGESGKAGILSQEDIDNAMKGFSGGGDGGAEVTGMSNFDEPVVRQADFQQLSETSGGTSVRNIDLLMDVDLPVSIELGRTRMNVSDILALGPGSVVELDKLVGEPVDLLVNSKCVARGEVVVVDENFGLRITQLVSPEERIKNLQ